MPARRSAPARHYSQLAVSCRPISTSNPPCSCQPEHDIRRWWQREGDRGGEEEASTDGEGAGRGRPRTRRTWGHGGTNGGGAYGGGPDSIVEAVVVALPTPRRPWTALGGHGVAWTAPGRRGSGAYLMWYGRVGSEVLESCDGGREKRGWRWLGGGRD